MGKSTSIPPAAHAEQTTLFASNVRSAGRRRSVGPATRATDPSTSHDAASRATFRLTAKQLAIVALLQRLRVKRAELPERGDLMTHDEIIKHYRAHVPSPTAPRMTDSSIRTRVKELVTLGYIERVDENGQSATGGRAQRWQLTSGGVDVDVVALRERV